LKFRTRLTLALTATTVLTFGSAFAAVSIIVHRSEQRELEEAVMETARGEARELGLIRPEEWQLSEEPGPAGDDEKPLRRFAAVFEEDGTSSRKTKSFYTCPLPDPHAHDLRAPFNLDCEGTPLRAVFIRLPSHPGQRLLFALPRVQLEADSAFLGRTMAMALIAGIAAAATVTFVIVRQLTRQHDFIADAARTVAAGDLAARVKIGSDDEDIVQLASDVNEMIVRLGLLVSSQQRFVAYAAHELRSPITALYGELQLATRKERSKDEYRQAINEALDSARRLKTLAEDLLALARIGAETEPLHAPVQLAKVVEQAASEVTLAASERSVKVHAQCTDITVDGRARDLGRVVRNLLDNAIRHSPEGGNVRVTLANTDDDKVHLAVEDEGPGVPKDDRERIFEPFYRSAKDHDQDGPGAGLGLAIVQEIAKSHGGRIYVDASSQAGARFVLELPSAPVQPAPS
jgi:two-component system heavy metal sensor histidine kinase CusS